MNEKIAVLLGGTSQERNISLLSGYNILNSLLQSGINAYPIDTRDFPITQLPNQNFTKVFMALHGKNGEDGKLQGVLDYLNIPYTGSKLLPSAIAINKLKTKLLWKSVKLPVIPHFYIHKKYFLKHSFYTIKQNILPLGLPLIIKPNQEGSSIGINVIHSYNNLYHACELAFQYDNTLLIEKFLYGEEYTVGILRNTILPSIRICPDNNFYSYNAKYLYKNTKYWCPSGLTINKERELKKIVKKAWNTIGGSDWGRIDLIMDQQKNFWLLELNTCPGMTNTSLIPIAAKIVGISYQELVKTILNLTN